MWRYRLLLLFLFIPLAIYTLWQSIRAFELRYFLQRLALFFPNKIKPNGIWFHAASVGEVNAAIPLILKIIKENPTLTITLTSNTLTSYSIVKNHLTDNFQHLYFVLDYRWAVKKLINKIKPKTVFIVETELWPNLYTELNKQNIPLNIINGRISERTLDAKKWLKDIYARILPLVTDVLARSELDQSRFIGLGLPAEKIKVVGNIKFSALDSEIITPINLEKKYVLIASTREDEEQLIVDAWKKSKNDNHLLVIVPRHPHRLSEILKQLKPFNLNVSVRSKNDKISTNTNIYIADTIGELKQFIAGSEFVLMGGSFVEKGGHNILEVAQLGKAVIFGPDMRRFMDEASAFLQYNAGVQCNAAELPNYFNKLLVDINYKNTIETNAKKLINENNNVEKYYDQLITTITK